jgi:hypothetical protein
MAEVIDEFEPAVDTTFGTSKHIQLDETSWVEHVPGWLRGSGLLFDQLRNEAPWEQHYRTMFGRRLQEPSGPSKVAGASR